MQKSRPQNLSYLMYIVLAAPFHMLNILIQPFYYTERHTTVHSDIPYKMPHEGDPESDGRIPGKKEAKIDF
jgi:hypothetical protein